MPIESFTVQYEFAEGLQIDCKSTIMSYTERQHKNCLSEVNNRWGGFEQKASGDTL